MTRSIGGILDYAALLGRDLPPDHLRELAGLLSRAAHCLERGWPEAAIDSIGRALGLLEGAP